MEEGAYSEQIAPVSLEHILTEKVQISQKYGFDLMVDNNHGFIQYHITLASDPRIFLLNFFVKILQDPYLLHV